MSQPSNINQHLGEAIRLGFAVGLNPGSGGTLDLQGKSDICFELSAGTYTLPNATAFTTVKIVATGAVTILSVAGIIEASLSASESAILMATSSTSWSGIGLSLMAAPGLPEVKFVTSSTTTTLTPAAGSLTGAKHVYWQNTADGTLALTTRTAAQMLADSPKHGVGNFYQLTIVNRGNNTITITGGQGVTITGENTVATLVTRTYVMEFAGAEEIVMTSVDKGTIET